MKRTDMFAYAMQAVIDWTGCDAKDKMEIIEELMHQKTVAKSIEEYEAKKAEEETK